MSKSNAMEEKFLKLYYQAVAWALIAENDTSSPIPNIYIAAHTALPGEGGTQATNEATFGSYVRIAVVRSAVGWTVTGDTCVNAALAQFAECTSGSETITHLSTGTASSGASEIGHIITLDTPRAIVAGSVLQFAAGAIEITED